MEQIPVRNSRVAGWLPLVAMATLTVSGVSCRSPALPGLPLVERKDCLAVAETYRTHRWTPSAANILHGPDADGLHVDTPDASYRPTDSLPGWWVPGQAGEGIPYQWGGFSSPEEFDAGVTAGRAAGDVCTGEKRRLLDAAVSRYAVGIDCSGFVSKCWNLPRSYSTRELASLCDPVSWEALKPGDALNTTNAHCLLFVGWLDRGRTRLVAYETGSPPTWKVVCHHMDTAWLRSLGYRPLRYRNMR